MTPVGNTKSRKPEKVQQNGKREHSSLLWKGGAALTNGAWPGPVA